MKKSWGLLPKIISGEKTVESRWYEHRVTPWDAINPGDTIYFKNSGEPVTVKATVSKVIQITISEAKEFYQKPLFAESEGVISVGGLDVETILDLYSGEDGIPMEDVPRYLDLFKNKKYCILIYLKNPEKVEPFEINKAGFGAMSAWITIPSVDSIKI